MELPLKLNPVKERRVKRATGSRCENCGAAQAADCLMIHLLPQEGRRARAGADLQREILVLCTTCHREIHDVRIPRADQKILIRARPGEVRREIRAILGYSPAPYTPPEEVDLATLYEEACRTSGYIVNGVG